ncbi:MAG TPA: hypothetical protein VKS21_07540 [Spirochaetota bacterium]|nr:hypothetical protein [Spirochaetota bacterium]
MNVFNPKDKQTAAAEKLSELHTREEIMRYAESMMLLENYSNAVKAYEKVIDNNILDAQARVMASIAVLKRDQLQVTNTLLKMINAYKADSNIFTVFINDLNSNPIFSSNGALYKVTDYLNHHRYSVFYGDCDNSILTNSIDLCYNLLLSSVLLLPASVYDSDGDFHFNETNEYPENGGDFLIYIDDNTPLEVNYDYSILTNEIDNSRRIITSNFNTMTNFTSTNFDFTAMDNSLQQIHDDTVEFTLEQMYNINIYGNFTVIDECIDRLAFTLSNLDVITNLTNIYFETREELLTNAGVENASNLLSGIPLNNCHVELNGQQTFDTNKGLSTYNFTTWPDFYSVQATNTHLQGYLKLMYESYQSLTAYPTNSADFSNYLTNTFYKQIDGFSSNYNDLSNNFTNLL